MRPLYVSPTGRGGVDFGIQNITRAVQRQGLQPALLRLPEVYNFAPRSYHAGLPAGWWRGFDLVQGVRGLPLRCVPPACPSSPRCITSPAIPIAAL